MAVKTSDPRPWNVLIRPAAPNDVKTGVVESDFRGAVLERDDGSILTTVPEGPTMGVKIREALEAEIRWVTIKSLENTDPSLKIEMRLVPVEVELNEDEYVSKVLGEKKEVLDAPPGVKSNLLWATM